MKKKFIVKGNKDFNYIINSCPYKKDNNLVIYYVNNNLNFDKFGISVGTKIGNAVTRNYFKRQIRTIIHNNRKNYQIKRNYIIIVRKNCLCSSYDNIQESYIQLMKKINIKGEVNEK